MTKMTGAEALLTQIQANGVDTIFGLPGGQLDYFFDAMYNAGDKIRLFCTRHEQGAAYMAFGYARSTGKTGVYTVVPGPGGETTFAAALSTHVSSVHWLKEIDKEVRAIVTGAADFAEEAPEPELSELYTDVLVGTY